MTWSTAMEQRIRELRERWRELSEAERVELRDLRRVETAEAFRRRRALYRRR